METQYSLVRILVVTWGQWNINHNTTPRPTNTVNVHTPITFLESCLVYLSGGRFGLKWCYMNELGPHRNSTVRAIGASYDM